MANKMLIDALHPEETRVVTVRGAKIEEFDFESASRRQLRGNIYLAKVTRVEPSLQAAFIEYGGNRHGFLAFNEIHPDYYQIPVADRQALLEDEARAEREEEEREERRPRRSGRTQRSRRVRASVARTDAVVSGPREEDGGGEGDAAPDGLAPVAAPAGHEEVAPDFAPHDLLEAPVPLSAGSAPSDAPTPEVPAPDPGVATGEIAAELAVTDDEADDDEDEDDEDAGEDEESDEAATAERGPGEPDGADEHDEGEEHHVVEQVGGHGDALAEIPERPRTHRRQYKIQEVIKRRQILLVQVVKEERGTKGAALTTYLSLAGRYAVLMPNTGKGGGISRKITSAADRKRLKDIATDLEVPDGMGVILRTAGASRTKPEIKRDFEYLMRVWESVRETTMSSTAPALVYEEGSLIKRAIRDLYGRDIEEILVAGEGAYREAKDFMRMLMPSSAQAVRPYREPHPLFARHGVEGQLDAMFSNHVSLRSGGYLVINPTEALVSVDVNSGRATREHDIEDTALKTNLEAAEEMARQLRLRDLAGLIVIDFIDMEEKRNNRAVEKRLNECLKNDRARIQVGRISPFGLLEMSRQRIRTGVLESSSIPCVHCGGSGFVRATASVALHVLRALEEALLKSASHNLCLRTRTETALYILNQKRAHLREIEARFGVDVMIAVDEHLATTTVFQIERTEPANPSALRAPVTGARVEAGPSLEEDDAIDAALAREAAEEMGEPAAAVVETLADEEEAAEGDGRRRRRRRRRGGRGEDRAEEGLAADDAEGEDGAAPEGVVREVEPADGEAVASGAPLADDGRGERDEAGGRRRRRGRRGGRGRERGEPRENRGELGAPGGEADEADEEVPAAAADRVEIGMNGASEPTLPLEPALADAPDREPMVEAAPAPAALEAEAGSADLGRSEPVAPTASEPEPVAVVLTPFDPDRPKRAGWWSRTKAALGGH